MERTTLFAPAQTWKGPNVSTFSSEWDDSLNSYLLAPDVIKPPPQFQDPVEPCQSPPASSSAIKKRDKVMVKTGTKPKDRKSRPSSAAESHKRSVSLSTAISSNPVKPRLRCESYALSYSSSSSDDSSSESPTVNRGDHIVGAAPQHRARSIILKKAKRKPSPPVRTVSLNRLADLKPPERRTQSMYISSDGQSAMLLPDLIPSYQKKAGDSELTTISSEAPEKVLINQPLFNQRSQKDLRFGGQCKSNPSSSVETQKHFGNADCNNSPSSSRSSPSQRSISSPTKPPDSASPSSGYSSQCETPTQSTSITPGPSSLVCRMRPKPPNSGPRHQARNSRARLSLQIPEMQASRPNPEPSTVLPKPNRRNSDASRPKQRLSNSMLVMPMVTLEELNTVRLRSVSSSELESTAEMVSGIIDEENEQDTSSVASRNSPKNKPPVAPKPALSKRPVNALPAADSSMTIATDTLIQNHSDKQENIYSIVNKINPNVVQTVNNGKDKEQIKKSCSQSQCYTGVVTTVTASNTATDGNFCKSHKTIKTQGPPVSKRPNMVNLCDNTRQKHFDKHAQLQSQQEYHVTVYGLIPANVQASKNKQTKTSNMPAEHEWYNKEEDQMPDIGVSQFVNEDDDVFLQKPAPHTTEDLFTIIHRSKRKIFGRKDSLDNKQSDLGTQTLGGVSTTNSQNDNFMALLRRTRSAKAGCGSRISATELLMSSKPAATEAAELTSYKKHNMMQ